MDGREALPEAPGELRGALVDRGTGKVKDAAGSVSDKVKDVVNPDRR